MQITYLVRELTFLRTFRHQLQHYTQQLVKDTNDNIKELSKFTSTSPTEKHQWKMQRDRLTEEFTSALTSFQEAQRAEAQKERDEVKRAKQAAGRVALTLGKQLKYSANDFL
jgi:Syntaxin-like protein